MANRGVLGPPGMVGAQIASIGPWHVPRGYIDGVALSNAAIDTNHDINFAAGTCRDSTDSYDLTLRTALVKQLDAAWVAGNNVGGLRGGISITLNTWYHCFLIYHPKRKKTDAFFDTSLVPTLPSGWTAYRRVGSILTDGSSNILQFTQVGDWFRWKTPVMEVNSTAGTSSANYTIGTPLGLSVLSWFNAIIIGTGSVVNTYFRDPDDTDTVPSTTAAPGSHIRTDTSVSPFVSELLVWTNTSSQVAVRATIAATTLRIVTLGWRDQRGKDS